MRDYIIFVLTLLMAAVLAFGTNRSLAREVTNPDVYKLITGQALYQQNCVTCHGLQGDGNGPAGAYLTPKPRNFQKDDFKLGDSVAAIANTIDNGIQSSPMPAFKGRFQPEELIDLAKYVLLLRRLGGK
jgi:mono/diheme cytochrome c family protein